MQNNHSVNGKKDRGKSRQKIMHILMEYIKKSLGLLKLSVPFFSFSGNLIQDAKSIYNTIYNTVRKRRLVEVFYYQI